MNKYIISVRNTANGKYENVEVTEEVYKAYMRNMDGILRTTMNRSLSIRYSSQHFWEISMTLRKISRNSLTQWKMWQK